MFGSKGKIDIAIQKFNYAPGDTISGNVALTLKKLVKAKEMSISLIGEQLITSTQDISRKGIMMGEGRSDGMMRPMMSGRRESEGITIGSRSERSTMTERMCIYDFKQQLDGEKEYNPGQEYYFFEMKIPADILSMKPQMMGATQSYPVNWYLSAKLDIPGGLDISKKVQVTIG